MKTFVLQLLELFSKEELFASGEMSPYSGIFRYENMYISLSKTERFPPCKGYWTKVFTIN